MDNQFISIVSHFARVKYNMYLHPDFSLEYKNQHEEFMFVNNALIYSLESKTHSKLWVLNTFPFSYLI